jgi:hypothetical protein
MAVDTILSVSLGKSSGVFYTFVEKTLVFPLSEYKVVP